MKRIFPFPTPSITPAQPISTCTDRNHRVSVTNTVESPPYKKQRLLCTNHMHQHNTNYSITPKLKDIKPYHLKYILPNIKGVQIRKNHDIQNPDKNPLITLHKAKSIQNVTAAIKLYDKMNKVCIGKETRSSKKIYISSSSPTAGLCSKNIRQGVFSKNKEYVFPSMQFCLMNYQCDCNTCDTININNKLCSFSIPFKWSSYILNSNYPSSLFSIEINDNIVGYYFVKTCASSNLKRMAQPSTFNQFRMSVSSSILLTIDKYPGLKIIVSNNNNNNNDNAIGIGYYYTGRNQYIIDLILCMLDPNNIKFTVYDSNQNTAKQISTIRFRMHVEQHSEDILLYEHTSISTNAHNYNTNIASFPVLNVNNVNEQKISHLNNYNQTNYMVDGRLDGMNIIRNTKSTRARTNNCMHMHSTPRLTDTIPIKLFVPAIQSAFLFKVSVIPPSTQYLAVHPFQTSCSHIQNVPVCQHVQQSQQYQTINQQSNDYRFDILKILNNHVNGDYNMPSNILNAFNVLNNN